MKKIVILICITMIASFGIADLAINWKNTSKGIYDVGGSGSTGPFITDGLAQLIWSPTGIQTGTPGAYNVVGGALLPGEILLTSTFTTPNYGFWSSVDDIYTNADVGGANINTGKFFTRIFQDHNASAGVFFIDVGEVDASAWVYNPGPPADPQTVYGDNAVPATTTINANNTAVIPEPGTFGLMGLAGLGLFMARRSALKKARRI